MAAPRFNRSTKYSAFPLSKLIPMAMINLLPWRLQDSCAILARTKPTGKDRIEKFPSVHHPKYSQDAGKIAAQGLLASASLPAHAKASSRLVNSRLSWR